MIEFRLSVDVLGNTRFAFSPLAEVASSVRLLGSPHVGHLHQPWLRDVREKLRDVDIALLCAVAPPGRWAPGFLYLPSTSPQTTLENQLSTLRATPAEEIRSDLETIWDGRSLPRPAQELIDAGDAGPSLLARVVWDYWQVAIQPYWSRMCGVLEDDVSWRAAQSLSGGLFDLLAGIHPDVKLDNGVLYVDKPHHADAAYEGAELTLIPSVFVWPTLIVSHSMPAKFALTYAARGVGRLWEGIHDSDSKEEPLGALLGRTRSAILHRLNIPLSTTQLSKELGQTPGSISQHLSTLKDSGMVTSWRAGRSVLYRQTSLAASVIAVSQAQDTATGSG